MRPAQHTKIKARLSKQLFALNKLHSKQPKYQKATTLKQQAQTLHNHHNKTSHNKIATSDPTRTRIVELALVNSGYR